MVNILKKNAVDFKFQEMCKLFEKLQTGSNIEYHCSCHCFYIGMFASNSNTELITLPEDLY